jgi:hypothetical protein
MSGKDKFSFGSSPKMLEVPLGHKAKFEFVGEPKLIETEWGEKYSFPILLINHPSYETLPFNCDWESKSQVAKELYEAYTKNKEDKHVNPKFRTAYDNSDWVLTRFDNGSYWIDQQ